MPSHRIYKAPRLDLVRDDAHQGILWCTMGEFFFVFASFLYLYYNFSCNLSNFLTLK